MRIKRHIFLVEHDTAKRNALSVLLAASRYKVKPFPSAEAFLEDAEFLKEGIILLDQCQIGMSGDELQHHLARRGTDMPIVFISECSDVKSAVNAIKTGVTDVLINPFSNKELLTSIKAAFFHADENKNNNAWIACVRQSYDTLTDSEREIMRHVITGMPSKEMAQLLGISHRTVEAHRASIMRKMATKSLPDLIRKYDICQNTGPYRLRENSTRIKH